MCFCIPVLATLSLFSPSCSVILCSVFSCVGFNLSTAFFHTPLICVLLSLPGSFSSVSVSLSLSLVFDFAFKLNLFFLQHENLGPASTPLVSAQAEKTPTHCHGTRLIPLTSRHGRREPRTSSWGCGRRREAKPLTPPPSRPLWCLRPVGMSQSGHYDNRYISRLHAKTSYLASPHD